MHMIYSLKRETYHVYMSSLCTYRAYELIKYIKNLNKIIHVIFIIPYMCMKFQIQISNNEEAVKKIKFLTDLPLEFCQKFLFFVIGKL
jgi:hypothetical protein